MRSVEPPEASSPREASSRRLRVQAYRLRRVAMSDSESPPQRLLASLERLLQMPTGGLQTTLIQAADLIAEMLHADKVDVFLYDSTRDSLNAICSSNQPLSALERKLGLEVLQLANGGRVVWVYKTGRTFATGNLQADEEELRGVKEGLGIRSKIGVPLETGGKRRGMVMIASLKPDHFSDDEVRYAETLVRWIGVLAHRAELAEEMRRNSMEQSRRAAADELIAVVAHDVRNYLAPIELRLRAVRGMATRDAKLQPMLAEIERIFKAVGQLRTLVGDLLDVARLDQGLFRIDPALLDLPELAEESARSLSRPAVNIDVRVQSTGKILVLADAARIRQCIDNLIVNAVEQSPEGGTVTVLIATETQDEGEYAHVQVIDEGPGVPPEILPRIFDRHITSKARGGGLGLGLFLAKRIAELHGGEISVESNPGNGARFTLRLPCQLQGSEELTTDEAP
jgi:two-component system, OmpR family, sensor kinase